MRDLANQKFSSSKGGKRTISGGFLRLVIVLAIIFGLGFLIKAKFLGSGGTGGSADVELKEAPRGLNPVELDQSGTAGKGVDIKSETAVLKLVKDGFSGKASATRSYTEGNYILNVDATLEDAGGYKYGVWAVDGEDSVLIDYMGGSKNSYNLRYRRGDDKFMKYDGIWITLERSTEDGAEEHVFEGTF